MWRVLQGHGVEGFFIINVQPQWLKMKMSENITNSRNKMTKCLFNDAGFCKFKENCRKQNFSEKCKIPKCDRKCLYRHPKQCKHRENCKFHNKNICAYDHDTLESSEKTSEVLLDNIKEEVKKQLDSKMNIEYNFSEQVKLIKAICEAKTQENEKLKRDNEIRMKISENKFKALEEKVEEIENLRKINREQKAKVEILEEKILKLTANQQVTDKGVEKTDKEPNENKTSEENEDTNKAKPKKTKLTKGMIEEKLITAYEKDIEDMFDDFKKSGLYVTNHKCKKCELEVHSQGILGRHKVRVHDSNVSKQNIILGFETDMQRYSEVLERMGKGLQNIICDVCDYKTYSKGKLTLHKLTTTRGEAGPKHQRNLLL